MVELYALVIGIVTTLVVITINNVAIEKMVRPTEYVEYSSAPTIHEKWHDYSLVGWCSVCGCDDAPIVHKLYGYHDRPACCYCMELKNINYHLKQHTTRAKCVLAS